MTEPIILAKQVHKTFRNGKIQVHALRGVDIEVTPGEMVAIMGPSGCGKTTLLNCLSGLEDFEAGEVFIDGTNLRSMNDRTRTAYRAEHMGFIFQTFNLLPVISAVENVELPLLVSGKRSAEARRQALVALDRVGLADRGHHRPAELSGGQRQRVTVARALVNNPAIVWGDEPTGNLDSTTAHDILSLMQQLNRDLGQTFVIVTHDPAIGAACDRIIHMEDGSIVNKRAKNNRTVDGKTEIGAALELTATGTDFAPLTSESAPTLGSVPAPKSLIATPEVAR